MKRAFFFLFCVAAVATALAVPPHNGHDLEYVLALCTGWGLAGELFVEPRLRRRLSEAERKIADLQENRSQLQQRLAAAQEQLARTRDDRRPALYPPHVVMDYAPSVRAKLPTELASLCA